jgi:mono/diheme cytochrome c family protein
VKRAPFLVLLLATAGCDLSMAHQPGDRRQGSAQRWTGGPPREAPPEGTIAADEPARAAALATPPPLTPALLDRGEERFGIYCSMCHGARGDGDGKVVRRGFPPPPSFHDPRLVAAPPAYIVDVITHGHGVMYSYADRVEPADRWAIAAYVKALQRLPAPENGR